MIESMIFVSQTYLGFATAKTLERAASQARLSLVLHGDEEPHPKIVPYISEIYRLNGRTRSNLQPSFDTDELTVIARRELDASGGDPRKVALFCEHEDNVLPTARVRHRIGIAGDGPELVQRFRDKIVMKQALAESHPEALPRYQRLSLDRIATDHVSYYNELVSALGTKKFVVKPTTGAGSLNVTVISEPHDLLLAGEKIQSDSREFDYEVDEFVPGVMHQCDSFIRRGKVVFCGILELGCTNFDFVQGKPLSAYPVTDDQTYCQLFDFNQGVVRALGFQNGSTHHELFVRRTAGGQLSVKFIEIAARVPGGLAIPYHERNSNINLIDANILLELGDASADDLTVQRRDNMVSALLPVGHGRIVSLNEPQITSEYSIDWRVRVGDVVSSRSLTDNAGILTIVNDDRLTLRRDFESLQTYVPVTCRLRQLCSTVYLAGRVQAILTKGYS
jgi:hypothetical protein